MKKLLFIGVLLVGCANVSTTKFTYTDPSGSCVTIEMPKEVEASDLRVFINALDGTASIEAKSWSSSNVETIAAQGDREGLHVEKAVKGAVEGVISGVNPLPSLP